MMTATLAELAEINPKGDRLPDDTPVSFVGMAEMNAVSAEALPRDTRSYGEAAKGYTLFRNGDILVAKITGCWENNKTGVARLAYPYGAGSTEFHVVRPRAGTDPRFLLHFLRQPTVTAAGTAWMTGSAGQKRVPASFLKGLRLPLPPIGEQRRIAAILDEADAIRTKRRQILADLDALAEATFHAMFEGEPATVTVAGIGSNIRTGPFGSQLLHSEFVEEGVAVLGLDNVVGNRFRWVKRRFISPVKYEQLKRYTVNPGDVLISIMGTTGRCVVIPDGIPTAINTKHICAITADRSRIEPVFLRASFLWHPSSREHLHRQTKGSIMDGLNMGIIKAMPIPTPGLDRQKEYVASVAAIDARRALVERAFSADDELFASLQSRAFRGEL